MQRHLKERRFNPALYSGIQVNDRSMVVALWNLSGQRVGYLQYSPDQPKSSAVRNSPDQKYWSFFSKEGDGVSRKAMSKLAAFGIELLDRSQKVVFVGEGIFDVAPFHLLGVNALAMLCNDPRHLHTWLHSLGYTVVALAEGDAAGRKMAKVGHYVEYLPEGKDPGDMPMEWFESLAEKYK